MSRRIRIMYDEIIDDIEKDIGNIQVIEEDPYKTILITKLMNDYFKDKKILYIANYLYKCKRVISNIDSSNLDHVDFMTYRNVLEKDLSEYDIIILDEFHRSGLFRKSEISLKALIIAFTPIKMNDDENYLFGCTIYNSLYNIKKPSIISSKSKIKYGKPNSESKGYFSDYETSLVIENRDKSCKQIQEILREHGYDRNTYSISQRLRQLGYHRNNKY